jgi:RNA ligase (TIGR02306 family)
LLTINNLSFMRQLATIQRIKALEPIENADAILKATVLGWQLVVKKDEFRVGDLCVYCEIDSLLPDRPDWAFLAARGWRIRTIRLRGQVSQGICFPLSVLPPGTPQHEGADVTDGLGIKLYEPPVPAHLAGVARGPFPAFVPKTDETRVQVLEDLLIKHAGLPCYITEKLDGSSATYYVRHDRFGVCSRSLDLLEDETNSFWRVARALTIEEKLRALGRNVAIQGELIGEGIQGNKYRLRGQTVRFFNAFDIDRHVYLNFADFIALIAELDLETVPILDTNWPLLADIPALVALSAGRSVLSDTTREGIVIRPLTEARDVVGTSVGRVSFKVISPAFLLKFDE